MSESATPAAAATGDPPAENGLTFDEALQWFTAERLIEFAISVGIFVVILVVGMIIGTMLSRGIGGAINRSKRKPSALFRHFVITWTGRFVVILAMIVALETIGVRTAPLIAGLGVAGFIVGFAVQGTLSNFASGMLLLVYQPFDEGDFCEVSGTSGKVKELTIVNTTLLTPDNRTVIIPNSNVWGSTIINFTRQKIRRVDMTVSVAYHTDLDRCRDLLRELFAKQPEVLAEPGLMVEVMAFADSSINFVVRPWVDTAVYWDFFFRMQREIKRMLDANDIEIPFPQRVVHMAKES